MVGIMAATSREKLAGLLSSAKFATDMPSRLEKLSQLKPQLCEAGDPVLIAEFLPPLLDLHSDRSSPVRKLIAETIGDIGLKHMEFIPDIAPILMTLLKDGTPAVARQAITSGIDLFRSTLVKVAIQGLYSSELDDSLESSWTWVLKLRDEIYSIAFQPRNDGTRLLALKFVEAVILLYTPDPSGSSEPPPQLDSEGDFEFNISWIRGGHPVLNVGDLSIEASQNLGLLLDQLRLPTVKSLNNSMIIVLINSLSSIAKRRPAFYGRILPVLLGLDPSNSLNKTVPVFGVHHALKNAFLSCLKCTHPSAAPWRDRLVSALRAMKAGVSVEQALQQVYQINGSVEQKDDLQVTQEKTPSTKGDDAVHANAGRKRAGVLDARDLVEEYDGSGKRARPMPTASEKLEQDLNRDQDDIPSRGVSRGDGDNGPVQQLVAMFGALVAQGEKAMVSLEILISSISADLLAEVVMANMRHLPPDEPTTEDNDDSLGSCPNVAGYDNQFRNLSSILKEMLPTSNVATQMDSVSDAKQSPSTDVEINQGKEERPVETLADNDIVSSDVHYGVEQALAPIPVSSSGEVPSATLNGLSAVTSKVLDVAYLESEIPGLDSTAHSDGLAETLVSSLPPTDMEDVGSLGRLSVDLVPSMSTDRSEELSPKATVTDVSSINSSTATSVGLPIQFMLPKMSAPVINLAVEDRDQLQKLVFIRIVEAYKQIAIAGGSHVRFSLLAYLAAEFPLDLDPWNVLQKHILSDYMNHEGHELTLHVLYRLFIEAEEEQDFISFTTAKSVYEMLLLNVAETLRDSFPASDKSLSRLLAEAPYLPDSIFKLLESLCSPGSSDKAEKDSLSGDRVHQGLSTVWSLILLRPAIRDGCLRIALQSAVHHLEEVRMKAIRLVANKLYPLSTISQQIEDFGKEMLYSVSKGDYMIGGIDGNRSEIPKDSNLDKPSIEQPSVAPISKDNSDASQLGVSQNVSTSLSEAQRCMSLYFALCTKKHTLFREIFVVYKGTSDAVKQAVHNQIPILVRTIGSSSELLEIISDPPTGSENLLMQVLHTLTDGTVPSPELVLTIKKLYDTKVKDLEVLIPVLSYLPKDEVLVIFPHLVNLPLDKFQVALGRILQGSQSGQVLSPAEVLIAIHGIDPDRDKIPLKKVTDACNACFEQRQIFTQQVLAKVLNQLVEQIPLPLLFMRTVLQAIGAFPALVEFIMEILSRLVNKQIWKFPKLWVGFLKCAFLTKPQSFSVLLQLPPAQLENALNRTAALKAPLVAHANQPNIRAALPRSTLAVLGIASDSQNSSQPQTTPAHTDSSQLQTTPAHTDSSQPQTTPARTVDTGHSDKEAVTEKPRESSSAS